MTQFSEPVTQFSIGSTRGAVDQDNPDAESNPERSSSPLSRHNDDAAAVAALSIVVRSDASQQPRTMMRRIRIEAPHCPDVSSFDHVLKGI